MKKIFNILCFWAFTITLSAQGIINNGASINISSGTNIVIAGNGNFTNQSSANLNLAGNLTFNGNLSNNATVNVASTAFLNVTGTGSLSNQSTGIVNIDGKTTIGGNITNIGIVNINSDASFINTGTISGTGTSNVKKLLTGGKSHYIMQPVAVAAATNYPGAFVFKYDENTSDWIPVTTGALDAAKAYSVEYFTDKTVAFAGSLNTGNKNMPVSNIDGGWNLVGNPYPSAIDWNSTSLDKTGIDNTIYFWNGSNYTYYIGTNPTGTTNNGALYTLTSSSIIPAMQGFFVKVKDNTASGIFGVTNAARTHNSQAFYKSTENTNFQHIRLIAKGNGFEDEALIAFFAEASTDFDSDFDAYKLITTNNEVPQVYTVTDFGTDLAINSLPKFNSELVIKCNFTAGKDGYYSMALKELNISGIDKIYIEDKKDGSINEVSTIKEYAFNYVISDNVDRFNIRFNKSVLGVDDVDLNGNDINLYAAGKNLIIEAAKQQGKNANITIFDLAGKQVYFNNLVLAAKNTQALTLITGTYLVKLTVNNQITSKKIIIE